MFGRLFIIIVSVLISSVTSAEVQEITVLEPSKSIIRELSGTSENIYEIKLEEGQYAKVIAYQRGIDVVLKLLTSDGTTIGDSDWESRMDGEEKIELVSDTAAKYHLIVKVKYPRLSAGRYEIQLAEMHNATEKDLSLEQARKLDSLALQNFNAGKFNEAVNLEEKCLSIRQKNLGPDYLEVAHSFFLLGKYCRNAGDIRKAEESYLRAQSILEKILGPEDLEVSLVLNNLGFLYYNIYDYSSAESLYQRSLMIKEKSLGSDHPLVAATLQNLGLVEWKKRNYVKAQNDFERALTIFEKTSGPESKEAAANEHNLGIVFKESGDYVKGEQCYKRALQIWESTLGKEHPMVAMALESLGILYRDKKEYERAEPVLRRSLEIEERTEGPNHPDVANTLVILARLYEAKGDIEDAVELQTRANSIEERNIALNISMGSERQKLDYLTQMKKEEERRISLHVRSASNDLKARELAVTTVLQRKGRVLDAMADSLLALRRRFSPEDDALLSEWDSIKAQLAQLVLGGLEGRTRTEYEEKLRELEERRDSLENEISRKGFGLSQPTRPVTLNAVRAAIPENAALIEFVVYHPSNAKTPLEHDFPGEAYYVAYIIRHEGEIQWQELGAAEEIERLIENLRESLSDPERKDVQHLARAVYEKVMQQVCIRAGNVNQLIISPDGALNLIPFEALLDEKGRYLIERYSVSYLTSGRDLLRMQTNQKSKSNPVVLANPKFGEPELTTTREGKVQSRETVNHGRRSITTGSDLSQVYFAPLTGTVQEAQSIKSLFGDARVLIGPQATEFSLKHLTAPRILHIATHGFFLTNVPASSTDKDADLNRSIHANMKVENPLLRSGLALAGANLAKRDQDDGILTALEASGLNLWGTNLVTLSACDTGLGEVKNGEGVYGLRRAFLLAGAETLVMSLWAVGDYVTREMMINYYRGLKQKLGRGEALRQVKLNMLKRKGREHPFYWASFIQSGEWGNLDAQR